jgi:hypothetical protein
MKYFAILAFVFSINFNCISQSIIIDSINNSNEPSIAMNPKNPLELVAGANTDNVYRSNDGGKTWIKKKLTSTSGVWGDPVLINDDKNNFYFFHLSTPNGGWGNSEFLDRIVCQKSVDAGNTWSIDTSLGMHQNNEVEDKPWAIYSTLNNEIYVSWTEFDRYEQVPFGYHVTNADSSRILFSKSIDGGISWSSPQKINDASGDCVDSDNSTEGAVPAVGPNGEVYVAWSFKDKILVNKSIDKGQTWWNKNVVAAHQYGGWDITVPGFNRTNGMPVTACDISNSIYKGNVYINYSDTINGINNTDVFIVKSTDGGNTFSQPIKVNNDNGIAHQFLNWMSVDPVTGFLYIIFYDRRNFAINSSKTELYMAISKDGGETFSNQKINDSFFISNDNIFAGDYINVIAYNGYVHCIWTELDSAKISSRIVTTQFHFAVDTIQNLPNCNGIYFSALYPNPISIDILKVNYCLESATNISIQIFSSDGKLVATLLNNSSLIKGSNTLQFSMKDLNLSNGIYIVTFKGDGIFESKKLVVINAY